MGAGGTTSSNDSFRIWAAVLGATGVGLGAFGAHALKDMLKAKGLTASWQSAVTYQLIHSLALLSLSTREVDHSSSVKWNWVGTAWAFGTCAFSFSIYGLCTDIGPKKLLGPITPIGGLAMMAGWGLLAFGSEGGPSGKED